MINRRNRNNLSDSQILRGWKNSLKNIPCFIIGNSPYLDDYPIFKLNDYFTIGINRAFLRIDPTILMWQDIDIYLENKEKFKELKSIFYVRNVANPANLGYNFILQEGMYKIPDNPSTLIGRGTTGPLAFQLAYTLGCNPIILLGCNCKYKENKTNFYGNNKKHNSFTLENCNIGLRWIKSLKTDRKIIICSENNTQTLEDILVKEFHLDNLLQEYQQDLILPKGREFYQKMLFSQSQNQKELK